MYRSIFFYIVLYCFLIRRLIQPDKQAIISTVLDVGQRLDRCSKALVVDVFLNRGGGGLRYRYSLNIWGYHQRELLT
jgi:hypothetical protein